MPRTYLANSLHATSFTTQQLEWACEEQQYLFNYGPEPICASGGYGAGKTIGFLYKLLWLMDAFPGNRVMVARSLFEHLKKTTMPSFFKICPAEAYNRGGRRADSDKSLKFNPVLCGDGKVRQSELIWMHMDDPALADIIKGLEINAFLLDQAEDMAEDVFEKLLGRLGRWDDVYVPPIYLEMMNKAGLAWEFYDEQSGVPRPPTYAMMTVNPEDELHWVYRRFHPEAREFREKRVLEDGTTTSYEDQGYKMVFMDSTKNKFLSKDNKRRMRQNDPVFVRRFVRGQWGTPEGIIHFIPKQCEVDWTPQIMEYIFKTCRLHRILDHGDTAPTCCTWWATDRDNNLICFREYYQPDKLISYHRAQIYDLSAHYEFQGEQQVEVRERYEFELADPSIFIKTMQKYGGKYSVADEYSDVENQDDKDKALRTAITWQPADNNEYATRNRVNEFLRIDEDHVNPFTKLRGAPHIYFVRQSLEYPQGCDMTLRETRSQRKEQIGTVMGKPQFSEERKKKIPDHAYDTVRYMVAARAAPAIVPAAAENPMSFAAIRREHIKGKKSGRHALLAKRAQDDADRMWGRRRRG